MVWLLYAAILLFSWWVWANLAKRLGYDSAVLYGFFMIVPLVGFVLLLMFALTESPNEQKIRMLKSDGDPKGVRCWTCFEEITPGDVTCPSCGVALRSSP